MLSWRQGLQFFGKSRPRLYLCGSGGAITTKANRIAIVRRITTSKSTSLISKNGVFCHIRKPKVSANRPSKIMATIMPILVYFLKEQSLCQREFARICLNTLYIATEAIDIQGVLLHE